MGPLSRCPAGHLLMAFSRGPPVERMKSRHLTSAGSPHLAAPSSSRYAGSQGTSSDLHLSLGAGYGCLPRPCSAGTSRRSAACCTDTRCGLGTADRHGQRCPARRPPSPTLDLLRWRGRLTGGRLAHQRHPDAGNQHVGHGDGRERGRAREPADNDTGATTAIRLPISVRACEPSSHFRAATSLFTMLTHCCRFCSRSSSRPSAAWPSSSGPAAMAMITSSSVRAASGLGVPNTRLGWVLNTFRVPV